MRVIGGTLKGRKLHSWKASLPLRPMMDQVKETVFNVLTPYFFDGCLFLDLFSGTGSIAIEALSRGAGTSHAVEKHPACMELIKINSQILPDSKKLVLHKKNVFLFLNQHKPPNTGEKKQKIQPFDIITADPPFDLRAAERIIKSLQNSSLIKKGTVTAIETGGGENLKSFYSGFSLFSKKTFNDKKIWFYEFQ